MSKPSNPIALVIVVLSAALASTAKAGHLFSANSRDHSQVGLIDGFRQPFARVIVPGQQTNAPLFFLTNRNEHVVTLRYRGPCASILPDQARPATNNAHIA